MWVTTAAALLPTAAAYSADSSLSMVVTVFLYLFLFGYSCTSWIDLDSMQFCGVHGKSNALRKNLDRYVPIRFLHTRRRTDADLLTTLYFSASKLFHDSYFSLSTTSFDFFPFFFVPESHTEREVPKGPRFAPSKWPLPAVRQSRAMPNRVLVGGHRLYGTTGALNLHNFGIFRFLFFRN